MGSDLHQVTIQIEVSVTSEGRMRACDINADPFPAALLARFGRALAANAVDALGDRIEGRSQARSRSGDADLFLLTSFLLSSARGAGGPGYGADPVSVGLGGASLGMAGYRAPLGGAGISCRGAAGGPLGGMRPAAHRRSRRDADRRRTRRRDADDGRDTDGPRRVGPGVPSRGARRSCPPASGGPAGRARRRGASRTRAAHCRLAIRAAASAQYWAAEAARMAEEYDRCHRTSTWYRGVAMTEATAMVGPSSATESASPA